MLQNTVTKDYTDIFLANNKRIKANTNKGIRKDTLIFVFKYYREELAI